MIDDNSVYWKNCIFLSRKATCGAAHAAAAAPQQFMVVQQLLPFCRL